MRRYFHRTTGKRKTKNIGFTEPVTIIAANSWHQKSRPQSTLEGVAELPVKRRVEDSFG